ncbi:YidC/Oxa1 family membrane protein insertase [Candidatus Uhrbacteria bacterium]|nr:YidC/Oxa1 family membrane protein insertase [Candidatus Uhrbacteria bacterium]
MLYTFWTTILYAPLLNVLVALYNTLGMENLGIAVIWLTVIIRCILLPLSFIEERNRDRYNEVAKKWKDLVKDIPSDEVLRRELFRKYLKEKRVSPWARGASLGLQLLVLVLLYQVFIGGFRAVETLPLYSFVERPEMIITSFFGLFDIAERNAWASLVVATFLFLTIWMEQRERKGILTRSQLYYRIFFPVFTFVALYLLPSVKSVFIMTSMLFTQILHGMRLLVNHFRKKEETTKKAAEPTPLLTEEGNPWEALRKKT